MLSLYILTSLLITHTVFSPINEHSKTRTPLISRHFFFTDTLINGHYFLHEIVNLAMFSLQLADSPKFLETTLEKMTKLNGLFISSI